MLLLFHTSLIAIVFSSLRVGASTIPHELTQEDSLDHLPQCSEVLQSGSPALEYCLNGSVCRIDSATDEYAQIVCDCTNLSTQNFFYAGPQCATKVMRKYVVQQARNLQSTLNVVNTSFLEDVLGMNQWKNDVNSVGPLPL
ncbi:hypothetical protein BgAZ_104030 [Babesia gibsoni]|uniref:Extracellular membrane protein CFEM domain-containing protein n=1 Tax=Babesia gibsoni TaxID=33632 RepID=A0AAD8PFQ0_BABGI|nr:hypothetical protein BgAZ_104030 [Babesia gibsoni]